MGVPKKLTEMQKRFCKILVYGDEKTGEPVSQTEAAIQAGYSRNRARTEGAELMNATLSPLVVAYKNKLDQEKFEKHKVTFDGHLAEMNRLKYKAEKQGRIQSAINAEIHRSKVGGIYIERKEVRSGKLDYKQAKQSMIEVPMLSDFNRPFPWHQC